MPMFEYTCRACAHQFEMLVLKTITPACPKCASQDLERQVSLPALKTEEGTQKAIRQSHAIRMKGRKDEMVAQREYELKHDD
jgi:putative FmdB family regulatory protein